MGIKVKVKPKSKLWIDDLRNPKSWVRDPWNWLWVKTAKEAIDALKSQEFKVISFDHDLGDDIDPESGKVLTGYDVALWIEENAYHGNIKKMIWRVHSANPVGYSRIEMALSSANIFWAEKRMNLI